MAIGKLILTTGATEQVGSAFIARPLADARFDHFGLRAPCRTRRRETRPRVEPVDGSIEQRADVERATREVTPVLHPATSKQMPDSVIQAHHADQETSPRQVGLALL